MSSVICFGEVLWDMFPTHKKVGGAPLNVALRLKSFGVDVHMISKIGKDLHGEELTKYFLENSLDITTIQVDHNYKTGAVLVSLDAKGSASYEIEYPVAWDKIEVNEKWIDLVKESDAFIFGSLACRDAISKKSLVSLLAYAKLKVFDVNLRPPHYAMPLLVELMEKADLIKCNEEELEEICLALRFTGTTMQEQIKFLSKKTGTNKICVTKGGDGAILFIDDQFYINRGFVIKVADTVGAGDSFLAALTYKLLLNTLPQEALDFATAVGTIVASKSGANPVLSIAQVLDFIENKAF